MVVSAPRAIENKGDLNGLLPLLVSLDQRLEQAIAKIQAEGESADAHQPYQGLIQRADEEILQMLGHKPGVPKFATTTVPDEGEVVIELRADTPIGWLQQTFDLSLFELEVLTLALAPELDRRYEQMYAYVQDDVRCKRPSVDLALNLLCSTTMEKLTRRQEFAVEAPLFHERLLHLGAPSHGSRSTLVGQELVVDELVIQLLLGQPGVDRRLVDCCGWGLPTEIRTELPVKESVLQGLARLTQHHWRQGEALRLYFQGPDRAVKRQVAIAAAAEVPVLVVDLRQVVAEKDQAKETLALIFRMAWFQEVWLFFDGVDEVLGEKENQLYRQLLSELSKHPGIAILSGEGVWAPSAMTPLGMVSMEFPLPDFEQRRRCWQAELEAMGLSLSEEAIVPLVDRFRLMPNQIVDAVATAGQTALCRSAEAGKPIEVTATDLFEAARGQSGHDLAALARKVEARYGWEDLVLPSDVMAQLRELCQEAQYHHLVWETWGFGDKLSLGKGLTALFSGEPGTGKTMAAEVIAGALGQDLYKIDLSQMVSKYIGETEKNLNRVFTAATNSNAILLFDEADALFGKRSEVRDAHDRYANIETSYLLQKMEEYEGVAILTTNLRSNMDEAFVRRLRFIVEFELPGVEERRRIWEGIWPVGLPRGEDLDFGVLAERFEVSGAVIRNIVLRAAFVARGMGCCGDEACCWGGEEGVSEDREVVNG